MKPIKLFFWSLLFIYSCSSRGPYFQSTFNQKNIKNQTFNINEKSDTVLTTKGGIVIKISKNTFLDWNGPLEISVKEVLSKADLLKSGLATIDSKGQLLASAGIVQITANPSLKINPNQPIEIEVPSKAIYEDMRKYVAVTKNGYHSWNEDGPLIDTEIARQIKKGKHLFAKHCEQCHSKSLDRMATAPALGCIEGRPNKRSRDWLLRFTKNSQQMIFDGDSLAMCLWNSYKMVMPNFNHLSDREIHAIYDFINNESILGNLCNDSTVQTLDSYFTPDCNISNITQSASTDTLNKGINSLTYYSLYIYDYQWTSINSLIKDREVTDAFELFADEGMEVYLIFKNLNSILPLYFHEGKYVASWPNSFSKTYLPVGEKVTVLGFGALDNGKRLYFEEQLKIRRDKDYNLEPKVKTISEEDFQKLLRSYK